MLQWIILLLLVGGQAYADNGTIYYSSDGSAWSPITTLNMTNRSGSLMGLQENTMYYLRCENETTNYSFTQRTKPAGEPGMASEGILIFMIFMTAGLFFMPKIIGRFSKLVFLDQLIKRCFIIGALLMIQLTLAVAATISENFGIGVKQEMFGLLFIVGIGVWVAIGANVLIYGKDMLDLWGKTKQRRQRGDDDEEQTN